ncbi:MAG: hypothetical protein ACM3XO_08780 [Bacteroidota bacterium]
MSTNAIVKRSTGMSLRTAAMIAGVGLLLMAILSPIAYLNTFQSLVKFDDAALTAQNILNSMGAFQMCILCSSLWQFWMSLLPGRFTSCSLP